MSLFRTVAAFAVAASLAAAAGAQDWRGVGRMEGKVLDNEGKPIADATVKLNLPSRGGGTTVKTDKKGKWAIGGIAAGAWEIDIESPGFVPKKLTARLAGEYERIPPIEVKLDKAAAQGPPPELVEALHKGDEAFKSGRYGEAREHYEKLLAARPELGPILNKQIAYTYSQEKNYAKELEYLQKVLDAEPNNVEIRTLMSLEAIEGGMLDRGLELLKTVDESQIKNPDVFYNVGVRFRNLDRRDDAIAWFTKAIAADPSYVDAYFQRALTYFGVQKLAEAKADFQKVLELTPTGPQADLAKKAIADIETAQKRK
ncbi:MAG TPA: tetratricopeptide repeat protein [Vicinamibacteria bacterium]|jgi:tetratricopeptide (TPR) repeat protein